MPEPDALNRLADACIAIHKTVLQCGSPEMAAVSRILLCAVGQRIAAAAARDEPADEGATPSSA